MRVKKLIFRLLMRCTGWKVRHYMFEGQYRITIQRRRDLTSCVLGVQDEPGALGLRYDCFKDLVDKMNC